MKTLIYTLAIALLTILSFTVNAQVNTSGPQKVYKLPRLDERSVITDSTGKRIDYTAWTTMVNTGRYAVKVVVLPNGKGALRLTTVSKAERDAKIAQMPKPMDSPFFTTGQNFDKNFKEKDFKGESWDNKRMKGKIVVMSFWYVNNVQCRQSIADMNELAAAYKGASNVVFISVPMDDKKVVEEYLQTNPLNYVHLEKGAKLSESLGIMSHPTSIVIDQNGVIQYHSTGYNIANTMWIGKTVTELQHLPEAPAAAQVFASIK
ncbi:TlpA family protein disulfide reductase [Mucilaginibacter terrae]|uniref:Peroxiredoxin n=1 Tax=Mucilaginibacter terrae TaxID=1955052 RepID=A0ABU3H2Q1_9SPHI|nr:TlpA disulfide reductase family protein [Mucilaginibacter terrae]MDT3405532.1 peroxiredoxin [Mucilaginibacter terrae]